MGFSPSSLTWELGRRHQRAPWAFTTNVTPREGVGFNQCGVSTPQVAGGNGSLLRQGTLCVGKGGGSPDLGGKGTGVGEHSSHKLLLSLLPPGLHLHPNGVQLLGEGQEQGGVGNSVKALQQINSLGSIFGEEGAAVFGKPKEKKRRGKVMLLGWHRFCQASPPAVPVQGKGFLVFIGNKTACQSPLEEAA